MRDMLLERLQLARLAEIGRQNGGTVDVLMIAVYNAAVVECKRRDTDGIATYEGLAETRKVGLSTVHDFFERNPHLKRAWAVFDKNGAIRERYRRAAARCKVKAPNEPVSRAALAAEMKINPKAAWEYLRNHRDLVDELNIVDKRRMMKPGSRGMRKLSKPAGA